MLTSSNNAAQLAPTLLACPLYPFLTDLTKSTNLIVANAISLVKYHYSCQEDLIRKLVIVVLIYSMQEIL